MRIAISTFYSDFNYGALLQATALCCFLRDALGHDARLLQHAAPLDQRIFRSWKKPRSYVRNLLILPHMMSMKSRARKTEAFMEAHQHWTEPVQSNGSLPHADAYVAGSDQVWNVEQSVDPLFFLKNANPAVSRLVSYAASFGTELIPEMRTSEVARLLKRFHSISVREESGADIVESLLGVRPPVVCDPVFLLSAERWRTMAVSQNNVYDGRYILVYAIRKDENLERCTALVKSQTGLPVLQLLPGFNLWALRCADRRRHDAGPGEFLDLVDHADFVCTNSFHCGAFSLLFGKPFLMTPSTLGRSTRLTHLLRLFQEENRYYEQADASKEYFELSGAAQPDKARWQAHCAELRAEGMTYLQRSLS